MQVVQVGVQLPKKSVWNEMSDQQGTGSQPTPKGSQTTPGSSEAVSQMDAAICIYDLAA